MSQDQDLFETSMDTAISTLNDLLAKLSAKYPDKYPDTMQFSYESPHSAVPNSLYYLLKAQKHLKILLTSELHFSYNESMPLHIAPGNSE
jgi:hypothetical protein